MHNVDVRKEECRNGNCEGSKVIRSSHRSNVNHETPVMSHSSKLSY